VIALSERITTTNSTLACVAWYKKQKGRKDRRKKKPSVPVKLSKFL